MHDYNVDEELKSLKSKWRENLDELHLLFSIAKEISFTRNIDLLLDQVVGRVAQVMRAEAASLLLVNPETLLLEFAVVKGQSSKAITNLDIHLRPGEGVAGWVFATNQYAIVNRPDEDSRFKPEVDWLTGFQTSGLLAVPMRAQGKTLGVLEVMNRQGGKDFTEHDAEFLTSIAWLVTMALDNAQTYKALEFSQEYLTNILENLSGGFIGVNMKNKITHCNSRAVEIFGFTSGDVIGHHFTKALAGHPGLVRAIEAAFTDNKGVARQSFTAELPWKGRRQIGYSTLPIRNKQGGLQGVGILFQDITDFSNAV